MTMSYLSSLEIHCMQIAIVILNLNRPGLIAIVILVPHVNDGADHVSVDLIKEQRTKEMHNVGRCTCHAVRWGKSVRNPHCELHILPCHSA